VGRDGNGNDTENTDTDDQQDPPPIDTGGKKDWH